MDPWPNVKVFKCKVLLIYRDALGNELATLSTGQKHDQAV